MISGAKVLYFWRIAQFGDGGVSGTPNIVFSYGDEEKVMTPQTVRAALQLPTQQFYNTLTGNTEMKRFLTLNRYEGSIEKLGQLKRPKLRKKWNFYFDCISGAFSNKCTNFDALHIMSQNIGYSPNCNTHYDFGRILLCFIADRLCADKDTLYYARFVS